MDGNLKPTRGYYSEADCDLGTFTSLVSSKAETADIPNAEGAPDNVPVYNMDSLRSSLDDPERRRALMAEWGWVLLSGPGVLVLTNAYADTGAIDRATGIFDATIDREKAANKDGADHFATSGANDRIWNSLQKLCEAAPEVFVDYFANTKK